MGEWTVRVSGSEPRITAMRDALIGPDWGLIAHGDCWHLAAIPHLTEESGWLVAKQAQDAIKRVNAIFSAYHGNDGDQLQISLPSYLRNDGTIIHLLSVDFPCQLEFGSTQPNGIVAWQSDVSMKGHPIPYRLAYQKMLDPLSEAAVCGFLSCQWDWTRIAKVVEHIEDKCNGKIPAIWVSQKRLALLRNTANSRMEAGGTGRHAKRAFTGPKRPMRIEEGRQIALAIIQNYLSTSDDS